PLRQPSSTVCREHKQTKSTSARPQSIKGSENLSSTPTFKSPPASSSSLAAQHDTSRERDKGTTNSVQGQPGPEPSASVPSGQELASSTSTKTKSLERNENPSSTPTPTFKLPPASSSSSSPTTGSATPIPKIRSPQPLPLPSLDGSSDSSPITSASSSRETRPKSIELSPSISSTTPKVNLNQ